MDIILAEYFPQMWLKALTNLPIKSMMNIFQTSRIKIFLEDLHKIVKLLHEGCIQKHSM